MREDFTVTDRSRRTRVLLQPSRTQPTHFINQTFPQHRGDSNFNSARQLLWRSIEPRDPHFEIGEWRRLTREIRRKVDELPPGCEAPLKRPRHATRVRDVEFAQ